MNRVVVKQAWQHFKIPPALGGHTDTSNVELASMAVPVSLMGQNHQPLQDLPPEIG